MMSTESAVNYLDIQGSFFPQFGKRGAREDEFARPRGIAVDSAQRVFVTEPVNNRVLLFDAEGRFLFSFRGPKKLGGQLNKPIGIAIDRKGRILVTDNQNNRIMVFSTG
jgi:DNA-binding beta-propeller fold protein YncE